ncbi:NACHT LRR and PYD domains-containing protein 1 [Dissostichus eleginoides]|uniref:NACHT LRR and PYD domains-containing protein 1 n=1 Tax=Dissostichus eleginoides TaxID=100907 RepID=A0AAD9F5H4_DISEL|nr:NACHT LRR and PYD domains-containing protein 1 [Dissostichus eleginoides]
MPAGPLLDITVTTGQIEEVHLPHRVCIDQNSTFSGQFAILHVDPCCDVVEEVAKVTSSHIKFLQPTFPPRGFMWCRAILLYDRKWKKSKNSSGSILILNPGPDKSMQMGEHVSLTTDQADAIIKPSARELRYESIFFEVLIRNADSDFTLRLQSGKETHWTCTIHKGDYQNKSAEH